MKKLFTSAIVAVSALLGSLANAQTWINVSGLTASKVSCGSAAQVVGLSTTGGTNNVFKLQTNNTWTSLAGELAEVSIANNGIIWGVNSVGLSYYRLSTGNWVNTPTSPILLKKITTNSTTTYSASTQASNNIYRYSGSGWSVAAGQGIAAEMSIAEDGTFIVANASNSLYKYTNNTWQAFTGTMSKVAVRNSTQMLGLRSNGLYIYQNGAWGTTAVRTDVRDISIASDGTVYIATTAAADNVFKSTWDLVTQPVVTPAVGLVAKYTFNAANANNEIGSNNNGTVTGATLSTDRFGNANKAYSFAGNTTDQINFGDLTSLNGASKYSIAMWLNQTQLDVVAGIWHKSKNNGGVNNEFIQSRIYNDGNLYGYNLPSGALSLAAYDYSQKVAVNEWFHYAIVFDGTIPTAASRYKSYINGVEIPNVLSGSPFPTTTPNLAGGNLIFGQANANYAGGNGWNGKIDDIYIYDGAISQAKIDSLKNLGNPVSIPSGSLVAKYTFNAANANNEIGSNNNGTVTGATLSTDRFGNANKAYSFAGNTTDQINFGDLTSLNSAGAYSIAMWLNQTQLDVIAGIWHKSKLVGTNSTFIQSRTYTDGLLYGYDRYPSSGLIYLALAAYDYSQSVSANQWFHYAIVFDGTASITSGNRYKTYINGVAISNTYSGQEFQTTSPDLAGGNLVFGQADASYFGGNGWNGKIDDIFIYNGAISQAKVDSLKNLGNPITSIKNMSLSDAKVSIYPNPSKGLVTIDSDENFTHYQLLNTLGQVMKSEVITSKMIDVSGVKSGIYQLILQDKNNGKIAKKLLIEN